MYRDKVIREFSECVQRGGWTHCKNCEYKNANVLLTCKPLAKEILALLKEQEAVKPKINEYGEAFCECGENVGIIPNSKQLPSVRLKFCPECGKPILWESR